jgi:hypothetical protein
MWHTRNFLNNAIASRDAVMCHQGHVGHDNCCCHCGVDTKKQKSGTDWFWRAKEWYDMIVNEMDLDACWSAKPLMNGKCLIQFLGLDKGPTVEFIHKIRSNGC